MIHVYVLLKFKKKYVVNRKEDHMEMEEYPYDENMEDVVVHDEREHGIMAIRDNEEGIYEDKHFLHANMCDIYTREKN